MDEWLALVKGPLFAFCFLTMLLGLARHVLIQLHGLVRSKGSRLAGAPWTRIAVAGLRWVMPLWRVEQGTAVLTVSSFLFHLGGVLVPLFLAAHVALWKGALGVRLPALSQGWADALTLLTLSFLPVTAGYRLCARRARSLSRGPDFVVLLLVFLPFLSGYLAAHPDLNPLPWTAMMLCHVLSGELLMLSIPFTKLAHVVVFPFDRLSEVHWQLRPGAGERVAAALYGKEARV
jgi:nitrate reductase gamma subunit